MLNHPSGENHLQPKNLAARAGRWSTTHRKTAIIGWILVFALGGNDDQSIFDPDTTRALREAVGA